MRGLRLATALSFAHISSLYYGTTVCTLLYFTVGGEEGYQDETAATAKLRKLQLTPLEHPKRADDLFCFVSF